MCSGAAYAFPTEVDGLRLRPNHLNQLFAYLCTAAASYPGQPIDGLLIYALVDQRFDTDLKLRQFDVRVRALDLQLAWPELRVQLCGLWPGADRVTRG